MQTYVKCFRALAQDGEVDPFDPHSIAEHDDVVCEDDTILETYLRDVLAPKDNLTIQDLAFANALAETYHESALTRRLTSHQIIQSDPEPISNRVPRHDLAQSVLTEN